MNDLLGKKIKTLRSVRELTQEQMAESLGISRQKYARIESGTNNITLEILSRIADVLDVTVSDITCVLDEEPRVAYRGYAGDDSSVDKIFDMLDLFYANKHMYMRLQPTSEE
ncbi:MAG: helix-turn-helix transcriptional regulator [Lachnospiraceae bacterium]|nr:helix-turn-helix transcriptional regulator [Lachnospiraceae bacterium]